MMEKERSIKPDTGRWTIGGEIWKQECGKNGVRRG